MDEVFNWTRPGYELVTVKIEWNVQVPYLQTTDGIGNDLESPLFSPQETPNSKWQLHVCDGSHSLVIYVGHCNSNGGWLNFVEPVLVKLSILNNRRKKVFQQMVSSAPITAYVEFNLSKEDLVKSNSQQSDGNYIFYCKILTPVKIAPFSSAVDPLNLAIDCSSELMTHLVNLFDNMQFSDVNFNIGGREFPAHKNILAARSKYFAAMFQHPMKEQSTNQVKIEDIEPDVFQELLRFIYTGCVPLDKLETMAAGLLIAADKYLMDELKMKCENYLLSQMSPDNCIILLLHGDLQNPAEYLKKAAGFFRRNPSQVMATDKWEKMKKENTAVLCDIHAFVYRHT